MSVSATLSNVMAHLQQQSSNTNSNTTTANGLLRRQRDRLTSERIPDEENDEEGAFVNNDDGRTDIEEGMEENNTATEDEEELEDSITDYSDGATDDALPNSFNIRHTMSLPELEEERDLARRRSNACVLFSVFILLRLWIAALADGGDGGMMILCLVATSWTVRWIRYSRDQEAELDRRIANYLENNQDPEGGREDIRMLSFQAQLALAIMESQRQMMAGGYGNPDGESAAVGVSDTAKAKWKTFAYSTATTKALPKHYGSTDDLLKKTNAATTKSSSNKVLDSSTSSEEEPHCSICLGEYEDGEALAQLPCTHLYHEDCIASWCTNHVRCPLCNCDLEGGEKEIV